MRPKNDDRVQGVKDLTVVRIPPPPWKKNERGQFGYQWRHHHRTNPSGECGADLDGGGRVQTREISLSSATSYWFAQGRGVRISFRSCTNPDKQLVAVGTGGRNKAGI